MDDMVVPCGVAQAHLTIHIYFILDTHVFIEPLETNDTYLALQHIEFKWIPFAPSLDNTPQSTLHTIFPFD